MDINILAGNVGIFFGFISSIAGLVVCFYSLKNIDGFKRRIGIYQLFSLAGIFISALAMERALLTHDFKLAYVYENNSIHTPLLYTITGLWSSLQGSLILWTFVQLLWFGIYFFRAKRFDPKVFITSSAVLFGLVAFFYAMLLGPANPFSSIKGRVPSDGLGPNPLLQNNALVTIHPVFLYAGFVGFSIPFAITLSRLILNKLDKTYTAATRSWLIGPFAFLSAGIILGAWWSYQVLGWGGFWAWDPVENAALIPWITSVAALHSIRVTERKSALSLWSLSLVLSTYCLTILGTFLTRSGIIESIHAFSDSQSGKYLLILFGIVSLASIIAVLFRAATLKEEYRKISTDLSRPPLFVLNNIIFSILAISILVGTYFPLMPFYSNKNFDIGSPYYNTIGAPVFLLLLCLMAIAPVLRWNKSGAKFLLNKLIAPFTFSAFLMLFLVLVFSITGDLVLLAYFLGAFAAFVTASEIVEHYKRIKLTGLPLYCAVLGRRGAGMVVHFGILIIAVGIISSGAYSHQGSIELSIGQTKNFLGQKLTYEGTQIINSPIKIEYRSSIMLDNTLYHPALTIFKNQNANIGTPAIDSSLTKDLYLTLPELPDGSKGPAVVGLIIKPLVDWIWLGGGVVFIGALLALMPVKKKTEFKVKDKVFESKIPALVS
jgi:cytochrome c-type biogenesis protein CcmF